MASRFVYVLKDSKHRKKINRQMIVASSDVNEKIRPVVIHKGLIWFGVIFLAVFIGISIGYFANEAGIINSYNESIGVRDAKIAELEAQVISLNSTIASKDNEIQVLSQTVNAKSDELGVLSAQIENMYVPTDFPMSGSASMRITADGDIPVVILTGSEGDFVRATASGTVIEIRTNPKRNDNGSIAEYYVAGESTDGSDKEIKDLGFYNVITIDHGNGYMTRYGHCSSIYVSVGEQVFQGQNIAAVGSTGWSTGPHCHFEIRIDGVAYNPLDFL
jgi:uncharacterized membrane protein